MLDINTPAHYFSIDRRRNLHAFVRELQTKLTNAENDRPLVFLCIGSDRATGDSLGPLVGQRLSDALNRTTKKTAVYGTLYQTVHAGNLADTLTKIQNRFSDPYIIAIDASLGIAEHVGYVTLGNGSLRPGIGVSQALPSAGDIHITGIVNYTTQNNHLTLQTTNLRTVMELSGFIAEGILRALHVGPSLQRPKKRHLINIFQIAAYRHAAGDTADPDSRWLY